MKLQNLDIDILLFNKLLRRSILFFSDSLIIIFSLSICFFENIISENFLNLFPAYLLLLFLSLTIYLFTGHYKSLTRYTGFNDILLILKRNTIIIFIFLIVNNLLKILPNKLDKYSLLWILMNSLIIFLRFSIRNIIIKLKIISQKSPKEKIAIYGAGSQGYNALRNLRISSSRKVLVFFDDNPNLWNRKLDGIPIENPKNIDKYIDEVNSIFFSIEISKLKRKKSFLLNLQSKGFNVKHVPDISEITKGELEFKDFKKIEIEDLLGRESVEPYKYLLNKSINNDSVLVTGAGGSIGSELCKQIINLKPEKLILLERNEFNLYSIEQYLNGLNKNIKIIPILGCAKNVNHIKAILNKEKVDIIFHAAAYKHVPLVESNPIEGLSNNIISTLSVCDAAFEAKLKSVILISSDKAVRPHNIMGASKRLAEFIIRIYSIRSKREKQGTSFSMVRFGNVLGSSGSVIPLFKSQIEKGGPLTVTHPDVIRYFMTTREAAELVIQSSALSENGDVFLLDMGEPIKIFDLAKQFIEMSGLKLKDEKNNAGEVEIVFTGLRKGEKLYEELLVDDSSHKTEHPRIFKAIEKDFDEDFYEKNINLLKIELEKYNIIKAKEILHKLVPEWVEYKE